MKFIKKYFLTFCFCVFLACLIVFSSSNIVAVKSGLNLWVNSVIPSLLPFFIASELLSYTPVISFLGNCLNVLMRPVFNVPGEGAFAFIMGIISGYPVGAKIVVNFRKKNICTVEEGERLLAFTNNSGPLFIIGTVGICFFNNTSIGILLFVTHFLASLTVGFLFRFWKCNKNNHILKSSFNRSNKVCTFSNLGEVLSNSILSSIHTIVLIGGFVVLFSVVLSILNKSYVLYVINLIFRPVFKLLHIESSLCIPFISGIVELTNGLNLITCIPVKELSQSIILCSFLLGFGGFSILLQVFGIISKSDVSIKPYIIAKLLQGTISAFYTFLVISNCSIFNLNLM